MKMEVDGLEEGEVMEVAGSAVADGTITPDATMAEGEGVDECDECGERVKSEECDDSDDSDDDEGSLGSLKDFIVDDDDVESSEEEEEEDDDDDEGIGGGGRVVEDCDDCEAELRELMDGNAPLDVDKYGNTLTHGLRRSLRRGKAPVRFTDEIQREIRRAFLDDVPADELDAALDSDTDDKNSSDTSDEDFEDPEDFEDFEK